MEVLVIALAAALLVGTGIYLWGRERRTLPDAPTIAERPSENITPQVPDTKFDPPQSTNTLAVLEIVEGPDAIVGTTNVGKRVEIQRKRITIGRNPRQVDIQLYNLDEPSSVSRLHCTLEFHEGLQCFMITDEGSSSGTRVEGRPVMPYQPQTLKEGDVIELGIIQKQGAVIRFHSAYNPPDRLALQVGIVAKDTIRQRVEVPGRGVSTQPVQRDVFISYSRRDREQMRVLRDGLMAHGLTVWSDENLEPGSQSWQRDVRAAIEGASCLVAVLSPEAKDSEWVGEELSYAKIRKLPIFTVLVRGDESNAVPFGLTGVQWVDMRTDFQDGIEELVHERAVEWLVRIIQEHLAKQ